MKYYQARDIHGYSRYCLKSGCEEVVLKKDVEKVRREIKSILTGFKYPDLRTKQIAIMNLLSLERHNDE